MSSKNFQLLDSSPLATHVIDESGRIVAANSEEGALLGCAELELIGKPAWELVTDLSSERSKRATLAKLEGRRPPDTGIFRTFKNQDDGRSITLLIQDKLLRNETGAVAGISTSLIDLSLLFELEILLRDPEAVCLPLLDSLRIPICVFKKDVFLRFTYGNRHFLKAINIDDHSDLLGKTDFDFYGEFAQKYQDDDETVMDTNRLLIVEEDHRWFDHQTTRVRVVKAPIRDADGKITGILGLFWKADQTAAVMAELPEVMRHSVSEYSRMFAQAVAGIFRCRLDGSFLEVNDAFLRVLDIDPRDKGLVVGGDWEDLYQDPNRRVELLRHASATRGELVSGDVEIIGRKRGSVWVREYVRIILDPSGEGAGHYIGFIQDITHLRQAETKYRTLFDTSSDLIYTHDLDGKFLSMNHIAMEILGLQEKDVCGTSIQDILRPGYFDLAKNKIREKLDPHRGGGTSYHVVINDKNKNPVYLHLSTSLGWDGSNQIIHGIGRNITQEISATQERQEATYRSILQLISIDASHRAKQPLANAMVALLNIKEKIKSGVDHDEILNRIQASIDECANGQGRIVEFIRKIQSERVEKERIHLRQSLSTVRNAYFEECRIRGVDFSVSFDEMVPFCCVDDLWFRAGVCNILENAIAHSSRGLDEVCSVTCRLFYCHVHEEVVCEISDSGLGFSEDLLRAFNNHLLNSSETAAFFNPQGTGIGLNMAHKYIVEIHDGKLIFLNIEKEGRIEGAKVEIRLRPSVLVEPFLVKALLEHCFQNSLAAKIAGRALSYSIGSLKGSMSGFPEFSINADFELLSSAIGFISERVAESVNKLSSENVVCDFSGVSSKGKFLLYICALSQADELECSMSPNGFRPFSPDWGGGVSSVLRLQGVGVKFEINASNVCRVILVIEMCDVDK